MMTNLFSSFDPSSTIGSMNWISMTIFLLALPFNYWIFSNKFAGILSLMKTSFLNETNVIVKQNKMFSVFLSSLFIFIIFNNFLGLFPYIFTSTSHMSTTLSLSLVLWVSPMLYGWIIKSKESFAHLVPMSTPGLLMPFMVLIESISMVIRPLTLAIRLSANMIAGHLLMTLLGNQLANLSMMGVMLPTEFMLVGLEMAVSLIQAYVFSILISLYISEVSENSH